MHAWVGVPELPAAGIMCVCGTRRARKRRDEPGGGRACHVCHVAAGWRDGAAEGCVSWRLEPGCTPAPTLCSSSRRAAISARQASRLSASGERRRGCRSKRQREPRRWPREDTSGVPAGGRAGQAGQAGMAHQLAGILPPGMPHRLPGVLARLRRGWRQAVHCPASPTHHAHVHTTPHHRRLPTRVEADVWVLGHTGQAVEPARSAAGRHRVQRTAVRPQQCKVVHSGQAGRR